MFLLVAFALLAAASSGALGLALLIFIVSPAFRFALVGDQHAKLQPWLLKVVPRPWK